MSSVLTDSSGSLHSHRRILVVSHDLTLRERLYDFLTPQGVLVKTIPSGQLALSTLRHERPDVVIADEAVSDCQGCGLPDCIRTFDAELPILLICRSEVASVDPRTASDVQAILTRKNLESALLETIDKCASSANKCSSSFETFLRPKLSGTALLIDDEPQLLHTLKEFLEARGCNVFTAHSGHQALSLLPQCHPTFALLDLKMPGMDGLVTLKKIKDLQPDLPVIVATAITDEQIQQEALACGAYEYLIKPYNLQKLQNIILHLNQLI